MATSIAAAGEAKLKLSFFFNLERFAGRARHPPIPTSTDYHGLRRREGRKGENLQCLQARGSSAKKRAPLCCSAPAPHPHTRRSDHHEAMQQGSRTSSAASSAARRPALAVAPAFSLGSRAASTAGRPERAASSAGPRGSTSLPRVVLARAAATASSPLQQVRARACFALLLRGGAG